PSITPSPRPVSTRSCPLCATSSAPTDRCRVSVTQICAKLLAVIALPVQVAVLLSPVCFQQDLAGGVSALFSYCFPHRRRHPHSGRRLQHHDLSASHSHP